MVIKMLIYAGKDPLDFKVYRADYTDRIDAEFLIKHFEDAVSFLPVSPHRDSYSSYVLKSGEVRNGGITVEYATPYYYPTGSDLKWLRFVASL